MAVKPDFVTAGSETEKIDVRLSYRIVRLFSEGLYASPNKAIEELVANSFNAGNNQGQCNFTVLFLKNITLRPIARF